MVVVSHAPELVDGTRSREILTRLFGTLSFGELGVDGFFIISGYLITASFRASSSLRSYVLKRTARILPGYLVAFAICFFVLAPLVGGGSQLSAPGLRRFVSQTAHLLAPDVPGAFAGLPYAALNGSMWTIAYEARCYVAVVLIGLLSQRFVRRDRDRPVLLASGFAVMTCLYLVRHHLPSPIPSVLGSMPDMIRLGFMFLSGAAFFLWRTKIKFGPKGAALALALVLPCLFVKHAAEPAVAGFGGYLVFWGAMHARTLSLSRMANRTDVSYGLYLYAWPIQNLLIWTGATRNPWVICVVTLFAAGLAGLASWILIEQPCLRLVHRGWPKRDLETA